MINGRSYTCLYAAFIYLLIRLNQHVIDGLVVNMNLVENAVAKGAVCLDGSPPAYHIDRGSGTGINNWLVQIERGGWCHNVTTCLVRKDTRMGSSNHMVKQIAFSGILSNRAKFNPDFHNWNRVKVRYCDGSSFTGDVEEVDPATNVHFRGARVWQAVMEELLAKGMRSASNVLLSGCSAGGLTSILHCDSFSSLFSKGTKVKCLSDAGYFINVKDISGALRVQAYYDDVVRTHGSANNLPASCTSRIKPNLCFFPQYAVYQTRTPLFILNAAYDTWQIKNNLLPGDVDPHGTWKDCKLNITYCSTDQLKTIQNFRLEFLSVLIGRGNPTRGMFINSCYSHCQSEMQEYWFREDSPVLNKSSIAEAVGDWYYDRSPFQEIDCPYPCDTSCHNGLLFFSMKS